MLTNATAKALCTDRCNLDLDDPAAYEKLIFNWGNLDSFKHKIDELLTDSFDAIRVGTDAFRLNIEIHQYLDIRLLKVSVGPPQLPSKPVSPFHAELRATALNAGFDEMNLVADCEYFLSCGYLIYHVEIGHRGSLIGTDQIMKILIYKVSEASH